jgi:hypothetical protein
MKNYKKFLVTASCVTFLALNACKSDTVTPPSNNSELLTTVRLTYKNTANVSDIVVATFKDLDGAGGAAPTIDNLNLKANTNYTVTLEVLDESKNPAENKTAEILAEGVEHQFFYVANPSNLLTVTYADKDAKNLPVGVATLQATKTAGTGTLKVTLKHQPNLKSATSTISTGETDIEVTFNVKVQ